MPRRGAGLAFPMERPRTVHQANTTLSLHRTGRRRWAISQQLPTRVLPARVCTAASGRRARHIKCPPHHTQGRPHLQICIAAVSAGTGLLWVTLVRTEVQCLLRRRVPRCTGYEHLSLLRCRAKHAKVNLMMSGCTHQLLDTFPTLKPLLWICERDVRMISHQLDVFASVLVMRRWAFSSQSKQIRWEGLK